VDAEVGADPVRRDRGQVAQLGVGAHVGDEIGDAPLQQPAADRVLQRHGEPGGEVGERAVLDDVSHHLLVVADLGEHGRVDPELLAGEAQRPADRAGGLHPRQRAVGHAAGVQERAAQRTLLLGHAVRGDPTPGAGDVRHRALVPLVGRKPPLGEDSCGS
jgi:hypothetical protein